MVQRSPTYVATHPGRKDGCVGFLPYAVIRRAYMNWYRALFNRCRWFPRLSRWDLLRKVRGALPDDAAELNPGRAPGATPARTPQQVLDEHFTPKYAPFDQRVCMVPDGDGAAVVDAGEGEAVEVPCDVCVMATGFNLQTNFPMGDMRVVVDGVEYSAREHFVYKSCMLSDVPNFFFCIGYVNNSWTIKSELLGAYVSDVIGHMDARGAHTLVARPGGGLDGAELGCMLPLTAGYVDRHRDTLPKVRPPASGSPWVAPHDYKP